MDSNQTEQAEQVWRQVVQETPQYRSGWRGWISSLAALNRENEIDGAIQRMREIPELACESRIIKATMAMKKGAFDEARQELEEARRFAPRDRELFVLAQFHFDRGDSAEAETAILQLIELDPRDGEALHNHGCVYARAGNPARAAEFYRESLRYRPSSPVTQQSLEGLARFLDPDPAPNSTEPLISE